MPLFCLTKPEIELIQKLIAHYEQSAGLCLDKKLEREIGDIPEHVFESLKGAVHYDLTETK